MKKRGIFRSFMITMGALGLFLVLLWVVFYYFTVRAFIDNTETQAETVSESVILSVEEILHQLVDTSYTFSHYDRVERMVSTAGTLDFFDMGQLASERSVTITGNNNPAETVLVIRNDGLYYRLKGRISNTAAKRSYYMLKENDSRIFTVSTNNTTYVACANAIESDDKQKGYVVLFMEKTRLENLLSTYSDVEYLGSAIMAGDHIICSNRDITDSDIETIRQNSAFFKEKDIGLSGFKLVVYSENTIPEWIERYFKLALPVTMMVLLAIIMIFWVYWNRHIVQPVNSIIKNTNDAKDRPLPFTGEEYFDDLVEHMNDTLARIEERDKELYDSQMKIKESELQVERSSLALLKKQIGAHFTVNTLNAVRALINKGEKEEAAKMCNELSGLLRYANAGEEYISLLNEFFVLDQYASIMKTRYPERFEFEYEDDEALSEVYIPRMLLQPLVENAIIHGFSDKAGTVSVSADIGEDVTIAVKDNGKGMSIDSLKELNDRLESPETTGDEGIKHVALVNIRRRIAMVCGPEYGLNVLINETGGLTVTLRLPLITEKQEKI